MTWQCRSGATVSLAQFVRAAVRAHAAAPLEISFCPHSVGWSTHHKQLIAVGTAGGVHIIQNSTSFELGVGATSTSRVG